MKKSFAVIVFLTFIGFGLSAYAGVTQGGSSQAGLINSCSGCEAIFEPCRHLTNQQQMDICMHKLNLDVIYICCKAKYCGLGHFVTPQMCQGTPFPYSTDAGKSSSSGASGIDLSTP